jgi:hypothetical protein
MRAFLGLLAVIGLVLGVCIAGSTRYKDIE